MTTAVSMFKKVYTDWKKCLILLDWEVSRTLKSTIIRISNQALLRRRKKEKRKREKYTFYRRLCVQDEHLPLLFTPLFFFPFHYFQLRVYFRVSQKRKAGTRQSRVRCRRSGLWGLGMFSFQEPPPLVSPSTVCSSIRCSRLSQHP